MKLVTAKCIVLLLVHVKILGHQQSTGSSSAHTIIRLFLSFFSSTCSFNIQHCWKSRVMPLSLTCKTDIRLFRLEFPRSFPSRFLDKARSDGYNHHHWKKHTKVIKIEYKSHLEWTWKNNGHTIVENDIRTSLSTTVGQWCRRSLVESLGWGTDIILMSENLQFVVRSLVRDHEVIVDRQRKSVVVWLSLHHSSLPSPRVPLKTNMRVKMAGKDSGDKWKGKGMHWTMHKKLFFEYTFIENVHLFDVSCHSLNGKTLLFVPAVQISRIKMYDTASLVRKAWERKILQGAHIARRSQKHNQQQSLPSLHCQQRWPPKRKILRMNSSQR